MQCVEQLGLNLNENFMTSCVNPTHKRGDLIPSLKVYPRTNSFYCFGCATGGDVIDFVKLFKGCDTRSAVNFLKEK
jgi:DNA primase